MKMRFFLLLAAMAIVPAVAHGAATVNAGAYPGQRNVTDGTGTALADNNPVEVGYFNSSLDLSVGANAANLALLNANWHLFGSTIIGSGPIQNDGRFADTFTVANSTFDNKPIVLWIFDTGGQPLAADLSNVKSYGLYTAPTWIFPATDATPPANSILISSQDTGLHAYYGGVLGDPTTGSLQLALVPEPSVFALWSLGIGMAMMVMRRTARR